MEEKESRGERLRALVNERQSALAHEMLALFERTVAELEEEVRVLKEENERQRQLLQSARRNTVKPEVPGKKTEKTKTEDSGAEPVAEIEGLTENSSTSEADEQETSSKPPAKELKTERKTDSDREETTSVQTQSSEKHKAAQDTSRTTRRVSKSKEKEKKSNTEDSGAEPDSEIEGLTENSSDSEDDNWKQNREGLSRSEQDFSSEQSESESKGLDQHLESETEGLTENSTDSDDEDGSTNNRKPEQEPSLFLPSDPEREMENSSEDKGSDCKINCAAVLPLLKAHCPSRGRWVKCLAQATNLLVMGQPLYHCATEASCSVFYHYHTGKRPCSVWDEGFAQQSNLTRHEKLHTRKK